MAYLDLLEGYADVFINLEVAVGLQAAFVEKVLQSFCRDPAEWNLVAPVPDPDVGAQVQQLPDDGLGPA